MTTKKHLILMAVALSCGACDNAPRQPELPSDAVHVAANEVEPLQLTLLRHVRLGSNGTETPEHLSDVIVDAAGIVVLDATSRHIHVYGPTGDLRSAFGKWGTEDGQLGDPQSLVEVGDTLLVIDATRRDRIAEFSRDGRFLGYRHIANARLLSSAAIVEGHLVAAGIIADAKKDGADVATSYDANGRPFGHGCALNPIYMQSAHRRGVLESYAFSRVTTDSRRVACVQPVSPVVHLLDSGAREISSIALIPPFYQAPTDVRASNTQPATFDYLASWTYHRSAYTLSDGFLSVYSRYDKHLGGFRFFLFRCHVMGSAHRCAAGESPGRTVGFHAPDTLFVQPPAVDSSAVQLDVYRVEP